MFPPNKLSGRLATPLDLRYNILKAMKVNDWKNCNWYAHATPRSIIIPTTVNASQVVARVGLDANVRGCFFPLNSSMASSVLLKGRVRFASNSGSHPGTF